MEKLILRMVAFLLWMFIVSQSLEICTSLIEGRATVALKHELEVENNGYTCSCFGVDCFKNDRAVATDVNYFPMRRFLRDVAVSSQRALLTSASVDISKPSPRPHIRPSSAPSPQPNAAPSSAPSSSSSSLSLPPAPFPAPKVASLSPKDGNMDNPSSTLNQPIPSPFSKGNDNKQATWVVYVVIAAAFASLIILCSIYLMFCRASKMVTIMPWRTGLNMQLQKAFVTGVPLLKRSELEIACEGFSNIIGTLSTCELYKGTLSNGAEIAVTSITVTSPLDWSDGDEEKFRNKISMLSKVNHKNFMNLIGYCEQAEPFSRMMVFEYAPNGTLFEHLHIKEAEQLDWAARLRIIMGIAYCLSYMEQLSHPLDLKSLNSSSIYLTEDHAAKLSDMKFWIEDEQGEQAETPAESSDQESIAYKFAIILLELISGRLPFSEDDGLLVLWASSYLSGKRPLEEIVDPTVKPVNEGDVSGLAAVIRSCVNINLHERPTMWEVCEQMRLITAISPDDACPRLSPLWWAELQIISS